MRLDGAQQDRCSDSAEGPDHVHPLRPSPAPDNIGVDDLESNRIVEGVHFGHRYDIS